MKSVLPIGATSYGSTWEQFDFDKNKDTKINQHKCRETIYWSNDSAKPPFIGLSTDVKDFTIS